MVTAIVIFILIGLICEYCSPEGRKERLEKRIQNTLEIEEKYGVSVKELEKAIESGHKLSNMIKSPISDSGEIKIKKHTMN